MAKKLTATKITIEIMPSNRMFFLKDEHGRVWGGDHWQTFGYPHDFATHRDALVEYRRVRELSDAT